MHHAHYIPDFDPSTSSIRLIDPYPVASDGDCGQHGWTGGRAWLPDIFEDKVEQETQFRDLDDTPSYFGEGRRREVFQEAIEEGVLWHRGDIVAVRFAELQARKLWRKQGSLSI